MKYGSYVDMQRYRLPGYQMQLLAELQKQQNSSRFCDILLQTEGISIPVHSCVLTALSPYLSQKLSAIPSPPLGQKRQLRLHSIKPGTLLKLVSLLYSGELELNGSTEQSDVLAAIRLFGMAELVGGLKDVKTVEVEPQERQQSLGSCRKMQDVQVQAEMAERRDTDCSGEKRSCVSTGTQTVHVCEKAMGCCFTVSNQANPPTTEPASSVAPNLDFSILAQPQNITVEEHLCSSSFSPILWIPNEAESDEESTSCQSCDSLTNPTATSQTSSHLTFPVVPNGTSSPLTSEGDISSQQSSEFAEGRADFKNGQSSDQMLEKGGEVEVMQREERGNCTEKRCAGANRGSKNFANMKVLQMIETAQISVKVRLRRRTENSKIWEVVGMQDTDETSVLSSLTQIDEYDGGFYDGPNHKMPQRDVATVQQPPPCITLDPPQKPDSQIPQPTSHDSQPPSSSYAAPNHVKELAADPLQPPQLSASFVESDEEIARLLEDIMMGLNILPNLERDDEKSNDMSATHNRGVDPVPIMECAGQSQMDTAVTTEGCVFNQDFSTQNSHPSTSTPTHTVLPSTSASSFVIPTVSLEPMSKSFTVPQNPHPNTDHGSFVNSGWTDGFVPTYCADVHASCSAALNQPGCTSVTPVPPAPDAVLLHQQQCSSQHQLSVGSIGQTDGMLPSQSQNSLYPEEAMTGSVIASALYSIGQEPDYPAFNMEPSQEEQKILEFLPQSNSNKTLELHSSTLPCLDELRLYPCLSPLKEDTSATYQPVCNFPPNSINDGEQQPSQYKRPWLIENHTSLQFPFSAIQLDSQEGRTCADSGTQDKVEEKTISTSSQDAAEGKSEHKRTKKSSKCPPTTKRRKKNCSNHLQEAAGSLLTYPTLKISDGTSDSARSVNLSNSNVLAQEQEAVKDPSSTPSKLERKTCEQSTMTEESSPKVRAESVNTIQTRTGTRGVLRKEQDMLSDLSEEVLPGPSSAICGPSMETRQESQKCKKQRGRPRKTNLEEQPTKKDLEDSVKMETMPKKRKRKRGAEVAIPQTTTVSGESTSNTVAVNDSDTAPTRPQKKMVSLEELQKLFKPQRLKTRKVKESQKMNATVEDKKEACADTVSNSEEKESTKETEMGVDFIQPEAEDIPNVTVDKNHNQMLKKSKAKKKRSPQGDTVTSCGQGSSMAIGEEDHSVSPLDILEKEAVILSNEGEAEQPLASQDQDTTQTSTNVPDSSHGDGQPTEENKTPPDHNSTSHTPVRMRSSSSNGAGLSSSHEEEEAEVDVVFCSPDKAPQRSQCNAAGTDNPVVTSDKEEEEEEDVAEIDVTEIDVTGEWE